MGYVCPSPNPNPNTDDFRILLVEDNLVDAEAVSALLKKGGWKLTSSGSVKNPTGEVKVLHVGTLSSALCALQAGGVDVVFLDLGLPDSMGIRTLDSVRGRYPDIPIVVLSGVNSYLDKDELASRGVFRVFKKK